MSTPPIQVDLLSDDDNDDNNNNNNDNIHIETPIHKKPRIITILDDDPTPHNFKKFTSFSFSSTPLIVPETPLDDMPKFTRPVPVLRCSAFDDPVLESGSSLDFDESEDVRGLICLESDDEADGGREKGDRWNNIKACSSLSEVKDMERSPPFSVNEKLWGTDVIKSCDHDKASKSYGHDEVAEVSAKRSPLKKGGSLTDFDVEKDRERSPKSLFTMNQLGYRTSNADFNEEKDLGKSPKSFLTENQWGYGTSYAAFDEEKDLEKSPQSLFTENHLGYGTSYVDVDEVQDLEKGPKSLFTENQWGHAKSNADFNVECLDESPIVVRSTYYPEGNLNSAKAYDGVDSEDDITQTLDFHDPDHGKENARLEDDGIKCRQKSTGNTKAQRKQKNYEQAANRKKSQEEKARLLAEKKLKKEQEKLDKAASKAEAAKFKQLEKDKLRWEKEAEKNILAEIDTKVIELGSIGGPLITRFGEKGLQFNICSNPIGRSIVWRLTVPGEISQLSLMPTDIPYVLLIYDAEEFCKVVRDGSIMDHISSVRNKYPTHTICCLTNRLASYINRREQHKYKNQKDAGDWERPPVEEVFARLTTHYANVHSRQCVDEAEVADHVAGLTVNLAKCRFRKKLTPLSVNANGANVPKDCLDRALIMKNPWLKALISIPKVQPRFAVAIYKKYPTLKSLLRIYMDPSKSVLEKEFLLKDLPVEGLGNEAIRLGAVCSKRVYRVLMAQNGSLKTDDVETGGDYFTTRT